MRRASGSAPTDGRSVLPVSAASSRMTSAWLTRMWSISSRRPLKMRRGAVSAGISGAMFHSRWRVALVGPVEAGGVDLRAGRAEQDLRGGRERLVVEVAEHDDARAPARAVEQRGRRRRSGDRLGGAQGERVAAIAGPLVLVARAEAAAGVAEQLRLQVRRHEVDLVPSNSTRTRSAPRPICVVVVPSSSSRTGSRAGRERPDPLGLDERQPREEADADAAVVGVRRERRVPLAPEPARSSSSAARSPTSWTASTSGAICAIIAASAASFARRSPGRAGRSRCPAGTGSRGSTSRPSASPEQGLQLAAHCGT